jgi:hypothetical protein
VKRSDLGTRMILGTVDYWGLHHAWERLVEKYPPKLVLAALEREYRAGRLECGVSERRPWLTAKGAAYLLGPGYREEWRP